MKESLLAPAIAWDTTRSVGCETTRDLQRTINTNLNANPHFLCSPDQLAALAAKLLDTMTTCVRGDGGWAS